MKNAVLEFFSHHIFTFTSQYLDLTFKSAVAYSGYATVSTSLPQLVTALGKHIGIAARCTNQIRKNDFSQFFINKCQLFFMGVFWFEMGTYRAVS